jgi:hypothetical protein
MENRITVWIVISIAIIGLALPTFTLKTSAATSTLADSLNSVINNVNWTSADSWTSLWGQTLGNQGPSAFDNAINSDFSSSNYVDALYVARLADLNGYSSQTIQNCTYTAIESMLMCGGLPANGNAQSYGDPGSSCFLVYGRYLLWAYQYAQTHGLTIKWNATQAFIDFARMYNKPPIGSASGEMLWCDPPNNWADSYSSRYYDEHAETLSVFLQLAEQGVASAMNYADKAWTGVQAHWNGQYYGYTGTSTVECEMGNFAQVIAEYMQQKGGTGNIPFWDRVIQDLNYKLLANGWSSPGWASAGAIIHAKGVNNELRLWETMGAITALQELYPYFTPTMQTSLQNMLTGSGTTPAWQGLMTSSLNVNGRFKGTSSDTSASNDATVCAAATLFLDGIVPVTGNLAIPFREENYNDHRTMFQTANFKFDYANHTITIPVNAGTLTFTYGTAPVSYTFPVNGIYTIQFSNDWNIITAVNGQPITPNSPSAPQNLIATAGNAQVSVSWTTPASNGGAAINGYKIYRGTSGKAETLLTAVGNVNIYTDNNVTNGQTYYYYVTAQNVAGESQPSNEASATPTTPIVKTLTVNVATDHPSYSRGASIHITATVKDSATGNPVRGATVKITVTYPSGKTAWTSTGTTDSTGTLRNNLRLSINASRGIYTVTATISLTGYQSATAKTTFNVT